MLVKAFVRIKDAGGKPRRLEVGPLGAPNTEPVDGQLLHRRPARRTPDAAHAWIKLACSRPEISIKDLEYHGYNSGHEEHAPSSSRPSRPIWSTAT